MTNTKGTYIDLYNKENAKYERIVQPFISAKKIYDALDVQEKTKETDSEKQQLDLALEYIEQLFDSPKITKESILNGVASCDLANTLDRILSDVMGKKALNHQKSHKQKATKKQNKN